MSKRLYVVRFTGGRDNRDWQRFYENVTNLNGKAPDYAGIQQTALIAHHVDPETVRLLCSHGFRGNGDDLLAVEEVTRQTLGGKHLIFADTVENYYLPFDHYTNIRS